MSALDSLSRRTFDSLDAMMLAWSDEAVQIAAAEHGMELDYGPESVAKLETVLAARIPVAEDKMENEIRLWGGYFGEVFRRRYPAEWLMAAYPGSRADVRSASEVAMPALDIEGSQIYPLLKVQRRLTMGPSEDLSGFFVRVTKALDGRPRKE
jgi:hypothetical protein